MHHIVTTILPPAEFSSMAVCASTILSNGNTLPTCTFNSPLAICSINSFNGVLRNSGVPPWYVVRLTADGIAAMI